MIIKSPYPDITIPDIPLTTYVLQNATRLGDKPALIDGPSGRSVSFAELAVSIDKVAGGLARRGFTKGDTLAIYSPNLPEYAIAFHAVAVLGGIVTTINPLYTAMELATQLKDANASYLITVEAFLDKAQTAAVESDIAEVFVFGEANGATPFAELATGAAFGHEVVIKPREDLIVLPYSSGTTGHPKGVMLTHHNLVANLCQITAARDTRLITEADTIAGVLPFFHIYGMVVIMNYALAQGATVVTMPRFDMEQFLIFISRYRLTFAHLVPPIVLGLAKHPAVDAADLTSLEGIMCGAAPLGDELARSASTRLGCTVTQGYGLTETSPVTHTGPSLPGTRIKPAAIGVSLPNTEVRIVEPGSNEPVAQGARGEFLIRGPQVMKGYLNHPEATALAIDEQGWFRTGDIGYVDEDDHFYVVDRVKELIKYKGSQIAPAELEAILVTHDAIADAAVIGRPDEEAGEVPKAFVVLKPDRVIDAESVMAHVANQVAPHKRIRHVEFVDEIPKSLSGKILRRVLVEREREAAAAQ